MTSKGTSRRDLLKAAGLACCLGHLDYDMQAGQGELLIKLFTRLADDAQTEQAGLRAHALAARCTLLTKKE
jgi:hypothetical protein